MSSKIVGLSAIVGLGVGSQLVASRLRAPAILFLLGAGVLAGPVFDLIDPDELLGDLLFPLVSAAVGILLFEGGLGLRFSGLPQGRQVVLRLVTVGVLVTWMIGAAAAVVLLGLEGGEALILGAVLVVSGPTVVGPLLRHARPREPASSVLRWEGIVIDPIGAILAIVVFDAVIAGRGFADGVARIVTTMGAGLISGVVIAIVLIELLRRHLVPDHLHNPFTLGAVIAAFAIADVWQPEAGLVATTVLGMVMANQRAVALGHIREFETDLGTLILGSLFVILGARIDLDELARVALPALGLLAVLVLVARPLAVYFSTIGTELAGKQRAYLAFMAPRGIVAAAVSAIFAIELEEGGQPFDELVPATYLVIIGTVIVYGVLAKPGAHWLQVSRAPARGIALVGGQPWALRLAEELSQADVPVLVVSTDESEVRAAAERGMLTYYGRLDSDDLELALDAVGVRQAIALSRTDELNAYGMLRLVDTLGRVNVFHLPPDETGEPGEPSETARVLGRRPFSAAATQAHIERVLAAGGDFVTVAYGGAEPIAAPEAAAGETGEADGDGQVEQAGEDAAAVGAADDPAGDPTHGVHGGVVLFGIDRDGMPIVSTDGTAPVGEGARLVLLAPARQAGVEGDPLDLPVTEADDHVAEGPAGGGGGPDR